MRPSTWFRRQTPAPVPRPSPPSSPAASGAGPEARIIHHGTRLLTAARSQSASLLSGALWSQKLMDWALKDEAFKVELFRFVDAFPSLRGSDQVHDHLLDSMTQPGVRVPAWMDLSLKAGGLAKGLFTRTMTGQIESMAGTFIAGRDAAAALPQLEALWRRGYCFSVDLLGEACLSYEEADAYRAKYLDLVETLPRAAAAWPAQPVLESDHLGALPRVNVSIKISSLFPHTDPLDVNGSIAGLMESILPVLETARRHGVFVNFDIEQRALKDLTIELFQRCCEKVEFQGGLALQAYLRSGDEDAERLCAWAARTGRQVTVRLVKGAYWDYETISAEQAGWPSPVWAAKHDTDACFERMAGRFIAQTPQHAGVGGVKLALGSHNARSIAAALAALEEAGLPESALELQMLHGMGDSLKEAARSMGLRLREYVPVGEMVPGMGYLVRRLLENTSNESWLKAGFFDGVSDEQLLASPHRAAPVHSQALEAVAARHALSPCHPDIGGNTPLSTEPARDFSIAEVRSAFADAVAAGRLAAPPADTDPAALETALGSLQAAFPAWRDRPWAERANMLVAAAAEMRQRRDQLSAAIIIEAGKPWREADGDVCEAIDFLEYYARCASLDQARQRLGKFVGEVDEVWHQGRGVAAVISPWNFPLAICCGMTSAALVSGNTVAVKPAEQTPRIAREMCQILWRAGVPRDCLAFVPGPGETVGAALVRDPRVLSIAFTGSKAVGLEITRAAAELRSGQRGLKRVVCEMGGKNAIIVDASADLDEAVLGVRQSAFGFAGQKCSACSRAIVLSSCHDAFLHRLVESTRSLTVGDPRLPGTDVGPVIDPAAAQKIRAMVEAGTRSAKLALRMDVPSGLEAQVGKPFVGPTIFSGVSPNDPLAREEIFGPVLAVIRVASFDEALEVANDCEYRLTGGVFTRKPSHLERSRREFHVGNLYLNRSITGALVGRQPFGGFGLSGGGTKAGGADYLRNFTDPRSCCENSMRRGFAPAVPD